MLVAEVALPDEGRALLREAQGMNLARARRGSEAEALLRQALEHYLDSGEREGEGRIRYDLAIALLVQGRTQASLKELEEARSCAEEIGDEASLPIIDRQVDRIQRLETATERNF